MIVDSSAIVAILKREPDWEAFSQILDKSEPSLISAGTYLEIGIFVDSWEDPILSQRFDQLLEEFDVAIEPFTVEQARIARQAYRDYGKGSGHPANLNFGDCFTYALARVRHEPVLFKGDDFARTDLRSALRQS